MSAVNIIFFVPELPALDSAVLQSQVLSVASMLNRQEYICSFVGAESTVRRAKQATEAIRARYGIEAFVASSSATQSGAIGMWQACRDAYDQFSNNCRTTRATHIYARSFIAAAWTRRFARRRELVTVLDVRGLVAEESGLRHGGRLRRIMLSELEANAIKRADRVTTVSNALARNIFRRTGRRDPVVIPSCVDEKRFHYDEESRRVLRRKYGMHDSDIVLCYAGGADPWQRIGDVIGLFKDVCDLGDNYKAMFLTREPEKIGTMLAARGVSANRVTIRSCNHEEMPSHLSAADVACIMRDDTVVNNVASPIKVAEYLACGLPIVLTRGIGDYSDSLAAIGLGLLLDESKPLATQVCRFIEEVDWPSARVAANTFACRELSLTANLAKYRELYQEVT